MNRSFKGEKPDMKRENGHRIFYIFLTFSLDFLKIDSSILTLTVR